MLSCMIQNILELLVMLSFSVLDVGILISAAAVNVYDSSSNQHQHESELVDAQHIPYDPCHSATLRNASDAILRRCNTRAPVRSQLYVPARKPIVTKLHLTQ